MAERVAGLKSWKSYYIIVVSCWFWAAALVVLRASTTPWCTQTRGKPFSLTLSLYICWLGMTRTFLFSRRIQWNKYNFRVAEKHKNWLETNNYCENRNYEFQSTACQWHSIYAVSLHGSLQCHIHWYNPSSTMLFSTSWGLKWETFNLVPTKSQILGLLATFSHMWRTGQPENVVLSIWLIGVYWCAPGLLNVTSILNFIEPKQSQTQKSNSQKNRRAQSSPFVPHVTNQQGVTVNLTVL